MGKPLSRLTGDRTRPHAVVTRAEARDARCLCGNLVARLHAAGVEILCRRCKRVHRIPWETPPGTPPRAGPPPRHPSS